MNWKLCYPLEKEDIDGTLQKSTPHLLLPNLDSTVQRWSER